MANICCRAIRKYTHSKKNQPPTEIEGCSGASPELNRVVMPLSDDLTSIGIKTIQI